MCGEGKRMAFPFGKTKRVPQAEGLVGVNGEKMAAIR
jgi:hypothetical protein